MTVSTAGPGAPARTRAAAGLWLTALAIALFLALTVAFVLLRPLLPIDETRYLTVAWEMWLGASKLVPHLNGDFYGHKPPLLFWLINLVWSATGVSEVAARLVAPAFGAASVGLTAWLATRLWPDDATGRAGRAALILATTGVFLVYGTGTMFDTMLTVATLLCLGALWRMAQAPEGRSWVLLGLGIALGIYAKGPVILAHVVPVALLVPLWRPDSPGWSLPRYIRGLGLGLALGVAVLGLWLVPALVLGGPAYREEVLWRQSAGRIVDSFAHARPWWWFLALLPVYLWPWGWSPAALRSLAPRLLRADPAARFVALQAVTGLVVFSLISGKQAHYLIPELPALALLFSRATAEGSRLWRIPVLLFAFALPLAGLAFLTGLIDRPSIHDLSLPWPFLVASILIVAALVAAQRLPWRLPAWALVAPLTLLAFHALAAPILNVTDNAAPVARLLVPYQDKGIALFDANYHGQFGFTGRLTVPVQLLRDEDHLRDWALTHPGGVFLTRGGTEWPDFPVIARQPFGGRGYVLHQVPEVSR